jgi:hypothetical protein
MPPKHQKYLQWNGDRFRKWAATIGENTTAVVDAILTGLKVEQQGYRSCMALLKLAEKYTAPRLENACSRALSYTPRPAYKAIQIILRSGRDRLDDEPSEPPSSFGFTRGADYYKGGND